jgi:hypothetical protein
MDDVERFSNFKASVYDLDPKDLRFALAWMENYVYHKTLVQKECHEHWTIEPTD